MSERIVLTPDEWARLAPGDFYGSGDGGVYVGAHTGGDMEVGHRYHALVALANAALPDTDPRKITRARVDALRDVAREIDAENKSMITSLGWADDFLLALADSLESYLPPA
jgi:hypothetical protein